MAFTASSQQPLVHFKTTLNRNRSGKKDETHRFTASYTFSDLMQHVERLWGPRRRERPLVISYVDEEGDSVRLCGEQDWEECLRLYRTHGFDVLRLTVRLATRRDEKNDDSADSAGEEDSSSETEKQHREECESRKRCRHQGRGSCHQRHQPHSWVRLFQAVRDMFRRRPYCCNEGPKVEASHESVVALLSALSGLTPEELASCKGLELFGPSVKSTPAPAGQEGVEAHFDIDLPSLYHRVVHESNNQLDRRSYAVAENILRAALAVYKDNFLLEYNLACALALQNHPEEALAILRSAIDHGYTNVDHLMKDPDLEIVRRRPEFESEILRKFTSVPPPPATAAAPTTTTSVPAPRSASAEGETSVSEKAPAQAPEPQGEQVPPPAAETDIWAGVPENIRTLISIFPGLSVAEAGFELLQAGGNLNAAVNNRLFRH
jgi:hypothetical protein